MGDKFGRPVSSVVAQPPAPAPDIVQAPAPSTANLPTYPPRELLNQQTSAEALQFPVAAENQELAIIYGRVRIAPMIADLVVFNKALIGYAVIGQGEIDGIESVTLNDITPPPGFTYTVYNGGSTQNLFTEPTLTAAWTANGRTWADALAGIAVIVFTIPSTASQTTPTVHCILRGRMVFDPRDANQSLAVPSSWKYSNNPALCTADFCRDDSYGYGKPVNTAQLIVAANFNDTDLGSGHKQRQLDTVIDQARDSEEWLETLRAYANCAAPNIAGEIWLLPITTGSPVYVFDRTNVKQASVQISERDALNQPTVVRVGYTDNSVLPWRDALSGAFKVAGVDAGTIGWRESLISLKGITRYAQATREANERGRSLTTNNKLITLDSFDETLKLLPNDLVTVNLPELGLIAVTMRITKPVLGAPGQWRVDLEGYDPTIFDNTIYTAPLFNQPNAGLPIVANIIFTKDYGALGWPGAITGGAIVGDHIEATSLTNMWTADGNLMWTTDGAALWLGSYAALSYEPTLAVDATQAGARLTLKYVASGQSVIAFYRREGGTLMWASDDTGLMWNVSSSNPMWNIPPYTIWPGEIPNVAADIYDFKIAIAGSTVQGMINIFQTLLDVQDIIERLNDIIVPIAGVRLPVVNAYRVIRNIMLTVQSDGGQALSAKVIDKIASGPQVNCFDTFNNPAAGRVDATVQGY